MDSWNSAIENLWFHLSIYILVQLFFLFQRSIAYSARLFLWLRKVLRIAVHLGNNVIRGIRHEQTVISPVIGSKCTLLLTLIRFRSNCNLIGKRASGAPLSKTRRKKRLIPSCTPFSLHASLKGGNLDYPKIIRLIDCLQPLVDLKLFGRLTRLIATSSSKKDDLLARQ